MEALLLFIQDHVQYAHWMVFGLLMLAGLNFPISEDLLIVLCGVFSSTVSPEIGLKLFIFLFLGAYLSDWMVYWIGRLWGSSLWRIQWFARLLHPKRLGQIEHYYKKYGLLTLMVGRFIPFGVRNCLFATAGMGKMHFGKFLLGDGLACLLSNTTLFTLSYCCGKSLTHFMKYVQLAIFSLFLVALIIFIWYKRSKSSIEKEID